MTRNGLQMARHGLGGFCASAKGWAHDGPLAPPASVCVTESSVARRRADGSGAPSPAGFGAFALLDGPGLTQV